MKFKIMYDHQGRPTQNYNPETLTVLLHDRESGMTLQNLADKYQVSVSTINRMMRRAKEMDLK